MNHFAFCSADCGQWDCPQHKTNADPEDVTLKSYDFKLSCPDYLGPELVTSEDFD